MKEEKKGPFDTFDKLSASAAQGKEINQKLSIDELKKELDGYKKQKEEYLAGWQRERADFLNYKKDEVERMGRLVDYCNEELIIKILPILDNFDLLDKKLPEDLKKDENVKGILQIRSQFAEFLKSHGVKEIKAVGEKFDPNLHEVVEQVPFDAAQGKEPGTIVEEIKKGYKSGERLLRPAMVKVVKG